MLYESRKLNLNLDKKRDGDFVLSRFTAEEKAKLPGILDVAREKIDEFVR